jgi:hypothetical protein
MSADIDVANDLAIARALQEEFFTDQARGETVIGGPPRRPVPPPHAPPTLFTTTRRIGLHDLESADDRIINQEITLPPFQAPSATAKKGGKTVVKQKPANPQKLQEERHKRAYHHAGEVIL